METAPSPPGHAIAGKGRNCRADEPAALAPRDQALRARILSHCKWIATFDRAEAIRAFRWYDELLPWLELRRKE